MTEKQMINIDGTEYALADLSDAARQQIANLRVADSEIQRLNTQLALAQTARMADARALETELAPAKKTTTRKKSTSTRSRTAKA
jgi:hypothetical protein